MPLTGMTQADRVAPCELKRPFAGAEEGSTKAWLLSRSKMALPVGMELVGDPSAWDSALIVQPETSAADMKRALGLIRLSGLEPLDEDEAEPELLEDGTVRFWLVPVDPDNPFEEEHAA